jgi:hypothetical protein
LLLLFIVVVVVFVVVSFGTSRLSISLFPAPFNRCYSIVEGKFVKDVNLIDVPKAENPKWQSVSLANTGRNASREYMMDLF